MAKMKYAVAKIRGESREEYLTRLRKILWARVRQQMEEEEKSMTESYTNKGETKNE